MNLESDHFFDQDNRGLHILQSNVKDSQILRESWRDKQDIGEQICNHFLHQYTVVISNRK